MSDIKNTQDYLNQGLAFACRSSKELARRAGPAVLQIAQKGKAAAQKASQMLDREVSVRGKSADVPVREVDSGEANSSAVVRGAATPFVLPPLEQLRPELRAFSSALNTVVSGRERETRLALVAWLAGGHLLIDGPPGLGKTTLARSLAAVLGRTMQRVQFTSDLIPADLLGASVYDREKAQFTFHEGPVFSDIVLADEINRAPPRAQSALLEAMAERRVSIEGETRQLVPEFFVVATQNPLGQIGTFPLPESQLDRFLIRVDFGNLDRDVERAILSSGDRSGSISDLPCLGDILPRDGAAIGAVHLSDAVLDYIQDLIAVSRQQSSQSEGLSVRAGLGLIEAARSWSWIHGRDAVEPEDVQAVFAAVAEHRLWSVEGNTSTGSRAAEVLNMVEVPFG